MKIYAIADIHLSGNPPSKPMEIFGVQWKNHWEKIKTNWLNLVQPEDYVLLAGDMSWALKLNEALTDLNELIALPGEKIMQSRLLVAIVKKNEYCRKRKNFFYPK